MCDPLPRRLSSGAHRTRNMARRISATVLTQGDGVAGSTDARDAVDDALRLRLCPRIEEMPPVQRRRGCDASHSTAQYFGCQALAMAIDSSANHLGAKATSRGCSVPGPSRAPRYLHCSLTVPGPACWRIRSGSFPTCPRPCRHGPRPPRPLPLPRVPRGTPRATSAAAP